MCCYMPMTIRTDGHSIPLDVIYVQGTFLSIFPRLSASQPKIKISLMAVLAFSTEQHHSVLLLDSDLQ